MDGNAFLKKTENLLYGNEKPKENEDNKTPNDDFFQKIQSILNKKENENLSLSKNMTRKFNNLLRLGENFGKTETEIKPEPKPTSYVEYKLPRKKRNDAPLRFKKISAAETKPVSVKKKLENTNKVTINTRSSKKFEKKKSLRDTLKESRNIEKEENNFDFNDDDSELNERGNINSRKTKNIDAILSKTRKEKNKPLRTLIKESSSEPQSAEYSESENSSSSSGKSVIQVVNIPSKVLNTRQFREILGNKIKF